MSASLTSMYPLTRKPAAPLCWNHFQFHTEGLQSPLGSPGPPTSFTPHFPWLSEQFLTELATPSSSLFLAPGFLLAVASHFLCRHLLSRTFMYCVALGPIMLDSLLPTVSPKEVSSCSIVLLIKNQQGSHIGISSESCTYLILPLGFLINVSYTTDSDWNWDPHLPPDLLYISVSPPSELCCSSR